MNHKIVFAKYALVAVLLLSATYFSSCERYVYDPPKLDPSAQISFKNDLIPILSKCTGCHGGAISPDLRANKAFESLNEGFINVSDPESSKLYIKINATDGHSARTSDIEKQKILAWIRQGAKNN